MTELPCRGDDPRAPIKPTVETEANSLARLSALANKIAQTVKDVDPLGSLNGFGLLITSEFSIGNDVKCQVKKKDPDEMVIVETTIPYENEEVKTNLQFRTEGPQKNEWALEFDDFNGCDVIFYKFDRGKIEKKLIRRVVNASDPDNREFLETEELKCTEEDYQFLTDVFSVYFKKLS